jgi:hypothetical protein
MNRTTYNMMKVGENVLLGAKTINNENVQGKVYNYTTLKHN